MKKLILTGTFFSLMMLVLSLGCIKNEKIGILLIDVGTPERNDLRFYTDFFGGSKDVFFPGWFAGGPFEGNDCYTVIHYADEAEAAACNVPEETPIDAFCNKYEGTYPIISLNDLGPDGDNSFAADCYTFGPTVPPIAFFVLSGGSTVNPSNGETIAGPVVKDPDAGGAGVPDFFEVSTFSRMQWLYTLPEQKDPHRKVALKLYYGNEAPGHEPDLPELSNIKDRLIELLPEYQLVFRHGWEGYMENLDAYGNPQEFSDSTETAIKELINQEKVSRIVVVYVNSAFNNYSPYGHDWVDENGEGVSALAGKTYKECIEDINDEKGPATQEALNEYLTYKPFEKHWQHVFPLAAELIKKYDPDMPVSFAPAFGKQDEYYKAGLETVKYAIEKYNIPQTASLKVLVPHHGFYSAYLKAQDCDAYFRVTDEIMAKAVETIKNGLQWSGKFEVVAAGVEFAEGSYDGVNAAKPTGNVMSAGEVIDSSINGVYVNALGKIIDNGTDNFDYIIVNPYGRTESQDSVYGVREETHGNFAITSLGYRRDRNDEDGEAWNRDDIDEEFYSVRTFDATGWPSYPGCLEDAANCKNGQSVYKGSAEKPTTVIVCGSIPVNSQRAGRDLLIEASAKSIIEAVKNPDARGVH
jgi:hypothetical protein